MTELPLWLPALTDPSAQVRALVARSLATHVSSAPLVVPALLDALVDSAAAVRSSALFSLSELPLGPEAITPLLRRATGDSSLACRSSAVLALCRMQPWSVAVVRALMEALLVNGDHKVRHQILSQILSYPGPLPVTGSEACGEAIHQDADDAIRRTAHYLTDQYRSPRGRSELAQATLRLPCTDRHAQLIAAIVAARSASLADSDIDGMARSGDADLLLVAIHAVTTQEDPAWGRVMEWIQDRRAWVRRAVLVGLGRTCQGRLPPRTLVELALADPSGQIRGLALQLLSVRRRVAEPYYTSVLTLALGDRRPRLRKEAARLLALLPPPTEEHIALAVQGLRVLLRRVHPEFVASILSACANLGHAGGSLLREVLERTRHPIAEVRRMAFRAARCFGTEDEAALPTLLEGALGNDIECRRLAVLSLRRFAAKSHTADRVLRHTLRDADRETRFHAAEALAGSTPNDAAVRLALVELSRDPTLNPEFRHRAALLAQPLSP